MRTIILLSVSVLISGCATAIPINGNEQCAARGMKLTGISIGSGYASDGLGTNISSSYSGVSCGVPQTDQESCTVERIREEVQPKLEYNENIGNKRFVTGTGYFLFIVPGVVAKVMYDSSASGAVDESQKIWTQNESKCSRAPASN